MTVLEMDPCAPRTPTSFSTSMVTFGYNSLGARDAYTVTPPAGCPQLTYSVHMLYRADGELGQSVTISGTGTSSNPGTTTYTDTFLYDQGGNPLELLRQTAPSSSITRYWYVLDGRTNVVALVNSAGVAVDRYAYDLWGEPKVYTETVPQPYYYASYWYDKKLGWYWLSTRSYDPEGRFLQPDPSEIEGTRSYVYVGDDPIDFQDPSGFDGRGCGGAPSIGPIPDPDLSATVPYCGPPSVSFRATATLAYQFLVGSDLDILGGDYNVALKSLALVDLLSNLALLEPGGGEALRGGVKGAVLAGREVLEHEAEAGAAHLIEARAARLLADEGKETIEGETIRVYRVEGTPNTRVLIGAKGEVAIQDKTEVLFLNFGNQRRAETYLAEKIRKGLPNATIKSFEVPQSFLEKLRTTAVLERDRKLFPRAPLHVDVKFADQYGLRPAQIEELIQVIIQGSGRIGL